MITFASRRKWYNEFLAQVRSVLKHYPTLQLSQPREFHNHVVAHACSSATPPVTGKAADVMLLERLQRNELLRDHYVKTKLFTTELMVSVKPFTRCVVNLGTWTCYLGVLEWSWIETLGFTYKQYIDFGYYYEMIAKRLHASATQLLRIDIMLTSYFSN
ncbi:hypothetical protein HanHA300_Chr11g0390541 [Helianthus annuus]|nr:hypothetical protein HanHA300_Chr11g0390541 [Helianthus annuus]KAJ0516407.1 hypothetical protein HanHA89_Chr11g0413531 [Helianthus annuus]KAJ0684411.1 hypothetical protein HanLR1_Chr11g0390911 [Helianthus annuus]KAJ0688354.1 hypothetical protein HanOQP8_Chr11g0393411 [Helianthus annuus]